MKKLKLNLEIEIISIEVDEDYFTILYKYRYGGEWMTKEINSDWGNGMTVKEWKECLEDEEAMRKVLSDMAEDY